MKLSDLPVHDIPGLNGPNAPIDREIAATELEVIGEMPKDLNGIHVRNGPNPWFPPDWRYHVYDGDGMLHAAYFDNGKVSYRNRWIRTTSLAEEIAAGHTLWKGLKEPPRHDRPDEPQKNNSNTDVKFHAGKLLTMFYLTGKPYHLDINTLETIGPTTYDGAFGKISAHSRPDENTGELLFFDYDKKPPYMTYGVIDAAGRLKHKIDIDLPGPRLPHDMAVT
jgi:carotenoid cleavage dioxygenase